MVKVIKQYRIFIATPSDIIEEREIISQIINEWNLQIGQHKEIHIEVTGWDTHSYPEVGDRPQGIINKQVLDSSDIVIGVFWTKFGTPTGVANSGTEEEIRRSIQQGKKVMVYFSDNPIPPSELNIDSYHEILRFKEEFKDQGLYFAYKNTGKFRELLRSHISHVMNDLITQSPEDIGTSEISISFPDTYWTIILASMDETRKSHLSVIENMRKENTDISQLDEGFAIALAAPYIIRAKIVDELFNTGVMTQEAYQLFGSDTLKKILGENEKN